MTLAQLAYEQFHNATAPGMHRLGWDELPPHVRQAWEGVVELVEIQNMNKKSPKYKKTLLIDFDAVLHQYTGWKEEYKTGGPETWNPPMEKARHAMHLLSQDFELVVFTSRGVARKTESKQEAEAQMEKIRHWLRIHGFPLMRVTNQKEPAFLQIDDRCICFNGEWTDELIVRVRNFSPYWAAVPQTPEDEDPVVR